MIRRTITPGLPFDQLQSKSHTGRALKNSFQLRGMGVQRENSGENSCPALHRMPFHPPYRRKPFAGRLTA